jgi:hypothetical protein
MTIRVFTTRGILSGWGPPPRRQFKRRARLSSWSYLLEPSLLSMLSGSPRQDGMAIRSRSRGALPEQAPGATLSACCAVGTARVGSTHVSSRRAHERSAPFDAARSESSHATGIADPSGVASISSSHVGPRVTPGGGLVYEPGPTSLPVLVERGGPASQTTGGLQYRRRTPTCGSSQTGSQTEEDTRVRTNQ